MQTRKEAADMFIKLADNRRKTLMIIGGFLSLIVLMIAVVMAVGYIFFRSYGWFNVAAELSAHDMNARIIREPFELAVVNDTSIPYDQRTPFTASDAPVVYLADEEYEIVTETSGNHWALYYRLSNEKPGAEATRIAPGDFGTVSFDIVPLTNDDMTLYIYYTKRGLKIVHTQGQPDTLEDADNSDGELDFLSGHVLFFNERTRIGNSSYYYYSDFFNDDCVEYNTADHVADRVTVNGVLHYRVTFYWVWPSTFAQIAFSEGDVRLHSHALFGNAADRAEFMEFVADNNGLIFKDLAAGVSYTNAGDENTYYIELSDGYNNADQVIGDSVDYYVLEANVTIIPPVEPAPPDPDPEP